MHCLVQENNNNIAKIKAVVCGFKTIVNKFDPYKMQWIANKFDPYNILLMGRIWIPWKKNPQSNS